MVVHYRPHYFAIADYAHFEFTSRYQPARRIPVSDTGYRSHFSPMHEVEAAPSVEEYAHRLVLALMRINPNESDEEEGSQLPLF